MSKNKQYSVQDLLRLPGEGERVNEMVIKARANDLSGQFGIMETELGPKMMISPHHHEHEAQAVYVISGELEFEVGGDGGLRFTAPAGSYIIKPRRVQHCFWNATNEPARYIELSGGYGFEDFVDDMVDVNPIQVKRAEDTHQVFFAVPRIPKLLAQHRLKGIHGMTGAEKSF